jgi:enoyl-CoA hydratase/carnithine racemase
LAFTGRTVDATEALDLGILLEVTTAEQLLPRARSLADLIAAKPAHSVRLAKRLLRQARSMDLDGFLELSAALQAISHHTDAHHVAVEDYLARMQAK